MNRSINHTINHTMSLAQNGTVIRPLKRIAAFLGKPHLQYLAVMCACAIFSGAPLAQTAPAPLTHPPAPHVTPPNVTVSIKPIHSLASAVMKGIAEPTLIIGRDASPHGYALRPSQARNLSRADLVIWVGPSLETRLARPIGSLTKPARVLTLMTARGMDLQVARKGGRHHHDGAATPTPKRPGTGSPGTASPGPALPGTGGPMPRPVQPDPHVWLAPDNARVIVGLIADRLKSIDPANGAAYQRNADRVKQSIRDLEVEIKARLAPARTAPFIVYHDAMQYFQAAFDLNSAGAFTVNPDQALSARRITEIRTLSQETGVRCLFREPSFETSMMDRLAADLGLRVGVLDPIGATLDPGPDLYFTMMRNNAGNLVGCLVKP